MHKFWPLLIFVLIVTNQFARAATDGVQINLTVQDPTPSEDGSGGGGDPPSPDPILGCTDSTASNYNSAATQNDGSCIYPVPNVGSLVANYNIDNQAIELSWQNPSFATFASVRVMRSTSFFP